MNPARFEQELLVLSQLEESLRPEVYQPLPDDWWIVIADVKGSTQAIEEGRYRDINAIGGSAIAAVLNALKPLKVPYVFGGDGATFCIPPDSLLQVKQALKGCQELANDALKLELRVGLVPVNRLTRPVNVCKYKVSQSLTQYFFIGGGLEQADRLIKESSEFALEQDILADADFSGFSCRWNEVPSQRGVTLSLLVKAKIAQQEYDLYQQIYQKIHQLLGAVELHHPLNSHGLTLSLNKDKLNLEVVANSQKQGKWSQWLTRQRIRAENLTGKLWMLFKVKNAHGDWGIYKKELIANSDYIKVDDSFRTVLAGDEKSVQALLDWLEEAYQNGQLFYGFHLTDAALITCLVEKTGIEHVHFVDANKGGYALAAKRLKQQIKQSATEQ
ncbi:MAG: DUF3095 domain-containing protein [Thiomicrorhabdus sp.]|nr:DUF3095 domain-containing protein [Thiomicrorhabdus sp.]